MIIASLVAAVALASAPLRAIPFRPLPQPTRRQCAQLQSRAPFVVLCPRRVPLATQGWRHGQRPAPWHSAILGSLRHPELPTPYGLELGYSAPVEPTHSDTWRHFVWHNRPCCFLHFTIWVPPRGPLPSGLRRARLGGKRGLILLARGYGLRGTHGIYWANHTWFFWRQHEMRYVASIHYFGRGTTQLLGRMIRELRPARELVRK